VLRCLLGRVLFVWCGVVAQLSVDGEGAVISGRPFMPLIDNQWTSHTTDLINQRSASCQSRPYHTHPKHTTHTHTHTRADLSVFLLTISWLEGVADRHEVDDPSIVRTII